MAVELSFNQNKHIRKTEKELGVNQNVLDKWRKE